MAYTDSYIDLLELHNTKSRFTDREYAQAMAAELAETLAAFKVKARITDVRMTPFAMLFDVMPDPGVSVKTFQNLRTDLEVHMASPVEIVSAGEQMYTISLAIKTWDRPTVGLREIMESKEFRSADFELPIAAGMDVFGKPFVFDLTQTPHLLVAGTTGSGKSVFLNDLILSMICTRTASDLRLIMVDPKRVELGCYNGIPHLMTPVISSSERAFSALEKVEQEMMRRYELFAQAGVKHLEGYREKLEAEAKNLERVHGKSERKERLPRVVVIIDEYMELMFQAPRKLEDLVAHLARQGRAAGIHLVMATQRPSSDVISNRIKADIPCRASFTVIDWRESKTILDRTGAERLLGNGDMLFSMADSAIPVHAQAALVTYEEIDRVIEKVVE